MSVAADQRVWCAPRSLTSATWGPGQGLSTGVYFDWQVNRVREKPSFFQGNVRPKAWCLSSKVECIPVQDC
jgi:hypothetical protein